MSGENLTHVPVKWLFGAIVAILVVAAVVSLASMSGTDRKEQHEDVLPVTSVADRQADADAKSAARNLAVDMETCFTSTEDYRRCAPDASAGQAEVRAAGAFSYSVVAHSRSGSDFTISKSDGGGVRRTCSSPGTAGCPSGRDW